MRRTKMRGLLLVVTALACAGLAVDFAVGGDPKPEVEHAYAIVHGAPGSGIEGVVKFKELRGDFPEPGVEVKAKVEGPATSLTPGRHGFHIHEVGSCEAAFAAAGGHFDPGPNSNSNPDGNHPFHMGDLPNLVVNEDGKGKLDAQTSRITLSPGPLSVFDANGSAVIVHLLVDQGTTAVPGGAGGGRIACGIIQIGEPND
jgi:Cu-Zn family superoxide dismutase